MSVFIMRREEALAIPDGVHPKQPRTGITTNFFDHFGVTGCLLDCESKRPLVANLQTIPGTPTLQTRSKARAIRRSHAKNLQKTRQTWFTSEQLARSKLAGCGSCDILNQILQLVSHRTTTGQFEGHEFSVTPSWEVHCRKFGEEELDLVAQLFQHPNVDIRFERMPLSNLLLGRSRSILRLKQWMRDCTNKHERCTTQSITWDDSMRPARLLHVNYQDEHNQLRLRLINTTEGRAYEYSCLSHRWDQGPNPHKTTSQNVAERLKNIQLATLPGNFRDAIVLSRELGIDYIWIDSLCIIQEGDSTEDKDIEIAKMGFIYQNAQLVIAAVSSPDSEAGCFLNDNWPDMCLQIEDSQHQALMVGARISPYKGQACNPTEVNDRYPLLTRAWVFQERLLSKRLLQCGYGEFSFDCLQEPRCECTSSLSPHPRSIAVQNSTFLRERHLLLLGPHGLHTQGAQGSWKSTVLFYWRTLTHMYMELDISYEEDVLPAIGGCAQILAYHLGKVGAAWSSPETPLYIAGLWKESLSTDLLWHVRHQIKAKQRPIKSTAPSWSWASVAMGRTIAHIGWGDRNSDWDITQTYLEHMLEDVCCELPVKDGSLTSKTNPFGPIRLAFLKLNATIYPWYIRYFCFVAKRESPGQVPASPDLFARRLPHSMRCSTSVEELDFDGALLELHLDACTRRDDPPTVPFTGCVSTGRSACALSEVYLLHVLRKQKVSRALDAFLVLQKIDPVHGKPNCYKRIGMWKHIDQEGDGRSWPEMIRGRLEPREEELWLF